MRKKQAQFSKSQMLKCIGKEVPCTRAFMNNCFLLHIELFLALEWNR